LVANLEKSKPAGRIKSARGIIILLVAFIVLASAYSIINPLHEATDELRHYRFVRVLATTGRLPIQGQEVCRSQSHHPPLFYALGALATAWIDTGDDICDKPQENPFWAYRYWEVGRDNKNQYLHGNDESFPWHGEALAAHIIRGINIVIGAGVVLLAWFTGRAIWPGNRAIALGSAAIVAFNPMILYMSGSINNDIIAAFSGAAVTYACVRLLLNPGRLGWRWGLLMGALYGLALMSKFNLAVILILIEAAITWAAFKKPISNEGESSGGTQSKDQTTQSFWVKRIILWFEINLLLVLVAGLVAGWWFLRNQLIFGEPTGFKELTELWGVRDPRESFGLAISELPYAWTTLWGRFGFGQIPLPNIVYDGLMIVSVAGLIGAAAGFFRRAMSKERLILIFLAADVLLFALVLFNYMLVSPAGPNGRFFFPAISALAILIFYGLCQWFLFIREWYRKLRRPSGAESTSGSDDNRALNLFAGVTAALFFALAGTALLGYLAPAYAQPPDLAQGTPIPNPVGASFDGLATLLGYEISDTTLQPGDPLDIDLYWEVNGQPPGDYLLFIHLQDSEQTMVAQRDTHPGLGNFPTSHWRPGDRFVERIRLYLPETAYAPSEASLSMGLYEPGAYRLAVFDKDGQALGDSLELTSINLLANGNEFPNPLEQNFNDEMDLVGYEYGSRETTPGGSLEIRLFWQPSADLNSDYIVQLELRDEEGIAYSSLDTHSPAVLSSTSGRGEAEVIEGRYLLSIDPSTPAGSYPVFLSLVNAETGWRPSILAEDGHLINTHLRLAEVRVAEE